MSNVDPNLQKGLTSFEWQSIQNQIMSNLSQQAYLKASNADADDRFCLSVAVSNDTIAVGAAREASAATGVNGDQNDNSASGSGAAYVFATSKYSGVIKDDHDNPWANGDILLGDGRTTKTNADGYYEFDVIASGELTVIPICINYRFAPPNGKVSWPDKPTQNFIIRPSNPEPFLDLPIDPLTRDGFTEQEAFALTLSGNIDKTGQNGKVNSWFDHQISTYQTDGYLTRWDGMRPADPIGIPCDYGNNCYDSHNGTDFLHNRSMANESIYAASGGIVFGVDTGCVEGNRRCGGGYGNQVWVNHQNGYATHYGHFRSVLVENGNVITIPRSTALRYMGNTGNSDGIHLHFDIYYDKNGDGNWTTDEVVDPFGWDPFDPLSSDPWSNQSDYVWKYSNTLQCKVPPTGTTQTSPTGFWTMQIPAGAVAEDVNLEILENPPIGPALVNYLFTGQNFLVRLQDGPIPQTETNYYPTADNEVQELLVPATLTAKYTPSQLPHLDLSDLAIFQWDDIGLKWIQLASTIDTIDNTIAAQTSNFGQFTLQAPLVCSNAVNEPNDNYDAATYLVENGDLAFDNFDIETDEDWFRLRASKGNKYEIYLSEINTGVEVKFEFYDKDGITLLFESYDPASIEWWAPDSGTYFIRVIRQTGGDFGCESTYSIELIATYYSFIPAIQR